jgi:hypothetical protein
MDEHRFDTLAVALSLSGTSRRQALTALAGVALGGLLAQFKLVPAAAGDCRPLDSACGPALSRRHGRPTPCCSHVCHHGKCDCPPGKTRCGGRCIGPDDVCPDCLGLGGTCESSTQCCDSLICRGSGGDANVCACPGAQVACKGRCVDTDRDAANCGSCGHVCPNGQICVNGACCVGDGRTCDGRGCCSGTCCAGVCCPANEVCGGDPQEPTCCVPNGGPCKDTCPQHEGEGGEACAGIGHCCSRFCLNDICADKRSAA